MSDPIARAARKGGGSLTVFGVVTIILGVLAMMSPLMTGVSIAILVGILLVAAGIARMVWAFRSASFGQGALKLALGGLTLLCGVLALAHPLFALGWLTLLLTAYFIVDGIFEIVAALRVKPASGWGWLLFGGIVSLALGIMIWRQFPVSGAWAIGILVGVKLLFAGFAMVTVGSAVRSAAGSAAGSAAAP
jgi:uncharacterized membrane protein HdeD (DUF308 family)